MSFFELAWLIPLLPLLAFLITTFFSPLYRDKRTTVIIAVGLMVVATFIAWGVLLQGASGGFGTSPAEHAGAGASETVFHGFGGAFTRSFDWASTGTTSFAMGYRIDAPVAAMLAMVTLAATCIHLFSAGYMSEDPRFHRFFSFIALFTASMLGMVLSNNLLLFFICWELMGLCSYLLIGFWYFKRTAYLAARKAFITTRIGDVGMMLGLFYLYQRSGSLTFGTAAGEVFNPELLQQLGTQTTAFGLSVAAAIALLIFMGTVGKSAQFPLHVWLPDAMEGPTPVSALIHAATMVAAGVFLVARTYPIFIAGSGDATSIRALTVVALIGAFTAIFASLIAVAQYDIKRILAYSTLSQLGFMVAALGVGGWVAAMFHLLTHAFFKALLFLGSGSVIHGMESTVGHDPAVAQDIRNMGNLRRYMPWTFGTYIVGYLALSGFPFFSGFFSKDEILADAFGVGFGGHAGPVSPTTGAIVYIALTIAAFFTAFYMTRQVVVVFFGSFRGHMPRPAELTNPSEKVPVDRGGHGDFTGEDDHNAAHGAHGSHEPHESPWTMLLPLVILSLFAFGAGYANLPSPWLSHFFNQEGEGLAGVNLLTVGIATVLALAGIALGYLIYRPAFARATDADPLERMMPGLFRLLNHKFYVDEFYGATIGRLTDGIAIALTVVDRLVDSVVNGVGLLSLLISKVNFILDDLFLNQGADTIAEVTTYSGDGLRQATTGKIQDYGALIFAGVLFLAIIYLVAF
ncbi:MAG: NADH-quinone oxidoreductase subunit L [Herpetosiphon sp.]